MQKVESFKHACEVLKRDTTLPDFSSFPRSERKAFRSLFKLTVIIKAQNKLNKYKVDWENHGQGKYYPWMEVIDIKGKSSGLGLAFYRYVVSNYSTAVGSRLCVGSSEEAKYIATKFTSLYEDWMLE